MTSAHSKPEKSQSKKRRRSFGPIIVGVLFFLAAAFISVDHFIGLFQHSPESLTLTVPTESPALVVVANRQPAAAETEVFAETVSIDSVSTDKVSTDDLKISLGFTTWKGGPQLLPSPLSLTELTKKNAIDLRGGGWVAIDVAQSQIVPVELFKSPQRGVIEAKYLDGRDIVNPTATGFPIVRGLKELKPGKFEVFENPPCLVRYNQVNIEEVCELRYAETKIRFRFEPPVLAPDEPVPDVVFSTVFIDIGRGRWQKIANFNESFHPIGDPNRDGYPDFYVESVTGFDESGLQCLLLSKVSDERVDYHCLSTRFTSRF